MVWNKEGTLFYVYPWDETWFFVNPWANPSPNDDFIAVARQLIVMNQLKLQKMEWNSFWKSILTYFDNQVLQYRPDTLLSWMSFDYCEFEGSPFRIYFTQLWNATMQETNTT